MFNGLAQDLRTSWRFASRRPAFFALAVATLALGIGSTAVVVSVMRAVILSPLPYPSSERLVTVWSAWQGFDKTWVSEAEVHDYREAGPFETLGAWDYLDANLTGGGEPERVRGGRVEPALLTALATRPLIGRAFDAHDVAGEERQVAILGYDLWQRRFAGDLAAVGRTIHVNGVAREIVGVMPPGFRLPLDFTAPSATELWLPLVVSRSEEYRGDHGLYAAARLRPGTSLAQANAALDTVTARLVARGAYPRTMGFRAFATTVDDEVRGHVRPAVTALAGAVIFLLLLACANVANLLLTRAEERQRELAVRLSLGASRPRLLRLLLAEGLVLATVGAAAGLVLAWFAVDLVSGLPLPSIPRLSEVRIDWTVVGVTALVSVVTTIVFGLAPAVHAWRVSLVGSLKGGGNAATVSRDRQLLRHALVAVQVASAVVLLAGAGLMLRTLASLSGIDPGFTPARALTARLSLPEATYPEPAQAIAVYDRVLARLRALPGVEHAGLMRSLPLADEIGDWGLRLESGVVDPDRGAQGDWQIASPGALEAMGERLVGGRAFTEADTTDAPVVALVNEAMAERYWPGGRALGQRFRLGSRSNRPWVTVVGVVANVRHNGLERPVKAKFYLPHTQFHRASETYIRSMVVVLRTSDDAARYGSALRSVVREVAPSVPVAEMRTLENVLATTLARPRLAGGLFTVFAGFALMLAAIGVYGVLAYAVRQRAREIGIRVALGAAPADVRRMVVRQGLAVSAVGAVAGLVAASFATRVLATEVHGVEVHDGATFALVPVVLLAVSAAASYLPARRATRIDPQVCLKAE